MAKRRKRASVDFDLEAVRDLKRLVKRVVRRLEDIERHMLKFRKAERQAKPTPAEVQATMECYGITMDDVRGIAREHGDGCACVACCTVREWEGGA